MEVEEEAHSPSPKETPQDEAAFQVSEGPLYIATLHWLTVVWPGGHGQSARATTAKLHQNTLLYVYA